MLAESKATPESTARRSAVANEALADWVDQHTAEGSLWRAEGHRIRCLACGHRCLMAEGHRGICKVRYNVRGRLRVPFGYVAGLQCDPVEKKPFFHVHPGSDALTFGMLGCDFHCSYCQNWVTSQALRDPASLTPIRAVSAEQLVDAADRLGAELVVSSYNEPLITAEWSAAVFEKAKAKGLLCAFVSNGNATHEVLDWLDPWLDAYKVDLKGFDDHRYRTLGGTLEVVKRSITMLYERGIWLEVLTLLVPGWNDSDRELRELTGFVASVSRDIPWHVTAFHQDYKMAEHRNTAAPDLIRACEIGSAQGLQFVYAGNLPGHVGRWEHTHCPNCGLKLIERFGYVVHAYRITAEGRCPGCAQIIPGRWAPPEKVRLANEGDLRQPRLVRVNGSSHL